MTVVFNDNPITTVVVNYLIVKEVRGQRTLQNADNVINSIPKQNIIKFHKRINNNRKVLLEHATKSDLLITKKKKGKQWTLKVQN